MKYDCPHSLCNAHHIRELTYAYEQGGQPWAQWMIGFLIESKQAAEQAKKTGRKRLDPCAIRDYENRYKTIIATGMKANPPPNNGDSSSKRGRLKRSKARNLVEKLGKLQQELLVHVLAEQEGQRRCSGPPRGRTTLQLKGGKHSKQNCGRTSGDRERR